MWSIMEMICVSNPDGSKIEQLIVMRRESHGICIVFIVHEIQ